MTNDEFQLAAKLSQDIIKLNDLLTSSEEILKKLDREGRFGQVENLYLNFGEMYVFVPNVIVKEIIIDLQNISIQCLEDIKIKFSEL